MGNVTFYGNTKQNAQNTFVFDMVYGNRKEMNDNIVNDHIFINRFVLVDYHYNRTTKKSTERFVPINPVDSDEEATTLEDGSIFFNKTSGTYKRKETNDFVEVEMINDSLTLQESEEYKANKMIDLKEYGSTYDGTVWMKTAQNKEETYILVGKFSDYASPVFDFVMDAPGRQNGMDVDYLNSGDRNYRIIYPNAWKLAVTSNLNEQMAPFREGTNISFAQTRVAPVGEGNLDYISFTPGTSETTYPPIIFQKVSLSAASYEKNKYYVKVGDGYKKSSEPYQTGIDYYTKTSGGIGFKPITLTENEYQSNKYYVKTENGFVKSTSVFSIDTQYYENLAENKNSWTVQNDTYYLDFNLPSLRNGLISLYDGLFGIPQDPSSTTRPEEASKLEQLLAEMIYAQNEDGTLSTNRIPFSLTSGLFALKAAVDAWQQNQPFVDWQEDDNTKKVNFISNRPRAVDIVAAIALWNDTKAAL